MIFSELYGAYYNAVAAVLRAAIDHPLEKGELRAIIAEHAFGESVLMHFAHFEKRAERLADDRCRVTILYDWDDETEMVIRILSFGPTVRVVEPAHFVSLMRERLLKQKSCGQ